MDIPLAMVLQLIWKGASCCAPHEARVKHRASPGLHRRKSYLGGEEFPRLIFEMNIQD
jgi:hypothetical protein